MIYKILYIDITGRRIGGGQRSLLDLVKGLDRNKFAPQVILSERGIFFEELKKNSIATDVFNMPTLKTLNLVNRFTKIGQIRKLIENQSINLVHANSLRAALYGGFAAKWAKVPLVYHVRVLEDGGLAERLVYSLSDKIIANSKAVRNKFSSFENFEKKVHVIYNAIDLKEFSQGIDKNKLKEKFGWAQNKIIGMVSEIAPHKGQEDFIRAASLIFKKDGFKNVKFVIVGDASNKEYEQFLKRLCEDLDLKTAVIFMGFRYDIEEIISAFDILVHCPSREGFGRVIVEAMALGVPVIATRTGGLPEIINNEESGLLLPPGDFKALSKTISCLLKDKIKTALISGGGKRRVREKFNLKKHIEEIEDIYFSLLRNH